jgi:hypothetical protein
VLVLAAARGGCTTARPAERSAAAAACPPLAEAFHREAIHPEVPLPERPHRWWWGAAEPGRVALRASYGAAGCPPLLQ